MFVREQFSSVDTYSTRSVRTYCQTWRVRVLTLGRTATSVPPYRWSQHYGLVTFHCSLFEFDLTIVVDHFW